MSKPTTGLSLKDVFAYPTTPPAGPESIALLPQNLPKRNEIEDIFMHFFFISTQTGDEILLSVRHIQQSSTHRFQLKNTNPKAL